MCKCITSTLVVDEIILRACNPLLERNALVQPLSKVIISQKLFIPKGLQLSFKLFDCLLQLIMSSVGLLSLYLNVLDFALLLHKFCTGFSQLRT